MLSDTATMGVLHFVFSTVTLAVGVVAPLTGGAVAGLLSERDVSGWYQRINKPTWTPPHAIFGNVWPFLYVLQGIASWMVFMSPWSDARSHALWLYTFQLALNIIWNPLLFKTHKTDIAFINIAAVLVLATATVHAMIVATHAPFRIIALMLPYVTWVAFATALTFEMWRINPSERAFLKGVPYLLSGNNYRVSKSHYVGPNGDYSRSEDTHSRNHVKKDPTKDDKYASNHYGGNDANDKQDVFVDNKGKHHPGKEFIDAEGRHIGKDGKQIKGIRGLINTVKDTGHAMHMGKEAAAKGAEAASAGLQAKQGVNDALAPIFGTTPPPPPKGLVDQVGDGAATAQTAADKIAALATGIEAGAANVKKMMGHGAPNEGPTHAKHERGDDGHTATFDPSKQHVVDN